MHLFQSNDFLNILKFSAKKFIFNLHTCNFFNFIFKREQSRFFSWIFHKKKLQFQVWGLGLRFIILFAFPDFTFLWKTTFLFHSLKYCSEPTDKRIFVVAAALKQGYTVEKLYELTKEFIIFFYIVIFYTTFILFFIYPLFFIHTLFILNSS